MKIPTEDFSDETLAIDDTMFSFTMDLDNDLLMQYKENQTKRIIDRL